jgi:hypothetical protein
MMPHDKEVVCLESDALYDLVRQVVARLKKELSNEPKEWITEAEAMGMLNISSKGTMQKFRNEGRIGFTKTTPKNILYSRKSIVDYLNANTYDTF